MQLLSRVWLFGPQDLKHARLPCPSPTPGACSDSCPLNQCWHPTISSSVVPFSCLESFSASGSFPVSQLFASSGQSIGTSTSASVLPVNIQDWLLLGWSGWISLQSKGLSRVFSNTTVQKHQFFLLIFLIILFVEIPEIFVVGGFDRHCNRLNSSLRVSVPPR